MSLSVGTKNKMVIVTYFDRVTKTYKSTTDPVDSSVQALNSFLVDDNIESYKVVVFRRLVYGHGDGYCSGEVCDREEQIYAKIYNRDRPEEEYVEEETKEGIDQSWGGKFQSGYCGGYVDDETGETYAHAARVIIIDTHFVNQS